MTLSIIALATLVQRGLLCITLSLLLLHAYAQDTIPKLSVGIMPQYLVEKGIRFNVERQLHTRYAVSLGLQYNDGQIPEFNNESDSFKPDEVTGGGAELMVKYFFAPRQRQYSNFYMAAGLAYHHFNINYFGEGFVPRVIDGIEVLVVEVADRDMLVNRYTFSLLVGNQIISGNRFLFDVYIGIGGRNTTTQLSLDNVRFYDDNMTNYAYSGLMLRAGFKLGVLLW